MLASTPAQALTRRRLREALLLYSLHVVPGIIAGGDSAASAGARSLAAITVRGAAFALLVVYLLDLQGETQRILGLRRGASPALGLAVALALFATALIVTTVTSALGLPSGAETLPGGIFAAAGWWYPLLVLAMFAVGYSEEIFFRAYLLGRADQFGIHPVVAIAGSSAMFAVGHLWQGPGAAAHAFVAGVVLAVLWRRWGTIHHFAIAHAAYNLGALLLARA